MVLFYFSVMIFLVFLTMGFNGFVGFFLISLIDIDFLFWLLGSHEFNCFIVDGFLWTCISLFPFWLRFLVFGYWVLMGFVCPF